MIAPTCEYLHDFKHTLCQATEPSLLPEQTASFPARWFWWCFWCFPSDRRTVKSVSEIRQLHCAPGYRCPLSRAAILKEVFKAHTDSTTYATLWDDRSHRNGDGVTTGNHLRCCARGLSSFSAGQELCELWCSTQNQESQAIAPKGPCREVIMQPWTRVFHLPSLRWQGGILLE